MLVLFSGTGATGQEASQPEKSDTSQDAGEKSEATDKSEQEDEKQDAESEPTLTSHVVTIAGQEIQYTATAGKMLMKNDEGDSKAHVFFVAYTKDDEQAEERPITYCFNGGPGSSSVWLHLGMLGPRRVKLNDDAQPVPPPHQLIDNQYSLLDVTDLVFIDPVSTGYSRPVKGEDKKQFHGYDEDLRSVSQFIHDYTTKYGRWGSPKFLLGESYGGLRAAGLSGRLQRRYRMYLNGIVLVSAVVDFQTLAARGSNDVAYVLFLPSYTATAWYHKALSPELQQLPVERVVALARRFASGLYQRALLAGDNFPPGRRQQAIDRMAELTGLSAEYIDGANLRVSMQRFGKELLRSRRRVVGRFDSRYLGIDRDNVGETPGHDPSGSALFGTFTSAMNQYLRDTLEVEEERVYEILTDRVRPWDYDEFTNRFVTASETLRRSMTENPYLKVFAACGYYDLATPGYAMQYTRDHLGLAPELRKNFTLKFYKAGHMMYVHEPSLIKLRKDLLKFYAATLSHRDQPSNDSKPDK
jgi:carboxypeptidase C (cathepsin A)